jgi:uncharacterized membrane protein SpoIIM required for sporulation
MKLLNDTLKKPSGKWDKQALTMFVAFCITIILGCYIVTSDYFLSKEINRYAIDVFFGFVALSSGQAAMNIWNKKVDYGHNFTSTISDFAPEYTQGGNGCVCGGQQ